MKGDFIMLNNEMWNIFKKIGNIEAYLYYKQYNKISKYKDDSLMVAHKTMIEKTKANFLC